MLFYYDNHVIVSSKKITCGNKGFPVAGTVDRIYDIDDFLLICDRFTIYIFCKKTKKFASMFRWESFVINRVVGGIMGRRSILIVNMEQSRRLIAINGMLAWSLRLDNDKICVRQNVIVKIDNIKEDWPTVALRTPKWRSFAGFEDIIVIV